MCDGFLKKSGVLEEPLHLRVAKGRMWLLAPPHFPAPFPSLALGIQLELSFSSDASSFPGFSFKKKKYKHRVVWLDKGDL